MTASLVDDGIPQDQVRHWTANSKIELDGEKAIVRGQTGWVNQNDIVKSMLEVEILAEPGPNPSPSKVYPAPYAPDMVLLLVFESSQSNVDSESLYLKI